MPPSAQDTIPAAPPLGPPSAPGRASRARLAEWSVAAALALATLVVYSPCFGYPFVDFDDAAYGTANRRVEAGLTPDGVRWAFTSFENSNWHPLTWLSLQLDATLFRGQGAGAFHRTNVLLHAANAVLLFLVLARMTGLMGRSAMVAALFALHPLHVESVAWVSERKDVLSTLFWVLALAAYLAYVRRPGVGRYLLVALTLALGLMAKAMLVTLPCVLLLLDYWPLCRWRPGPAVGRVSNPSFFPDGLETRPTEPRASDPAPAPFSRLLLEKVPLFGLVLVSCVLTVLAQSRAEAVQSFASYPLDVRVWNALLAYVGYLGKMLWPAHLAVYYPHPGAAVSVGRALGAGALLLAITALVLGPGRRRPYLAVGWLWYLGTLVPVVGLVQVGAQAMADRYTYVPLIGPFLLLTWGAADLATAWRLPRPYLAAAAALVLSACTALTWGQEGSWRSSLHLWEHAVQVTGNNLTAHMNLGACYHEQHMDFDARKEFEKAVALAPGAAAPHYNLGVALAGLGRREEAEAEYRRATDLDPGNAWAHDHLGNVLEELGRVEEAVAEYRRATELDPGNAWAHDNLGLALVDLGRLDEAAAEYHKALELGDERAGSRLQACARLTALRARLPGLLAGQDRPADNAERLAFADLCRRPGEGRYALAARLYADAFRTEPDLADDPGTGNRLNAAVAAAAAGCGQGRDAAGLDDREKARLRRQALSWLRADLAVWTRQGRGDRPEARLAVQRALRRWQREDGLGGVRDPVALARLPEAEREAWQQLWQDVEAVLAGAAQDRGAGNGVATGVP